MTKRKRLSIYKKALADYTAELRKSPDGMGHDHAFSSGLCFYFAKEHNEDMDFGFPEFNTELDRTLKKEDRNIFIANRGELKPRINFLKRVIKKMES